MNKIYDMPKKLQPSDQSALDAIFLLEVWGSRIRERRKYLKLSHAQLAQRIGVSQPTISRMERGDPAVAAGSFLSALFALSLNISLVPFPESAEIS